VKVGEARVPAWRGNRPEDLAAAPHVAARAMLIEVQSPDRADAVLTEAQALAGGDRRPARARRDRLAGMAGE
jgi:crotonobetainyl-CoA:carnitine CoA-transferase CaiB-like acyl-CoA transferase